MAELDTHPVEAPAASPEVPSNRKAMFIVFLVVFIDLLGFGIVLPLLPLYATYLLTPIYPNNPDRVGGVLAVLMSSFSLMQFIFAPIWGRISDRVGRRPILLLGLSGSVIFYALFGYASHVGFAEPGHEVLALVLILVARVGAGIAGATISTAQAVIADSTTRQNRSKGMALIGAAFGIGFTFGPLLCFASFFIESKAAPGLVAATLSLGALILAIVLLPETLPRFGLAGRLGAERGIRSGTIAADAGVPQDAVTAPTPITSHPVATIVGSQGANSGLLPVSLDEQQARTVGRRHWIKFGALVEALRMPEIGALIVTFFLATIAFGSLESTLALMNEYFLSGGAKVQRVTQMSEEEIDNLFKGSSLIFAYVGLTLMIVQGLIYRRLVTRVGEVPFIRIGTLLMVLGLVGVIATVFAVSQGHFGGLWTIIPMALVILAVLVTGFALMTPSVQALISKRADPLRQGEILGANQSASALARILGPAIGSALFFVSETHVLPYVVGACLMVVVFLLTLRLRPA
jgi:DHA1 family tetracycline resistance protein-like MFS transporter